MREEEETGCECMTVEMWLHGKKGCAYCLKKFFFFDLFIVSFYLVNGDVRSSWNNNHRGSVYMGTREESRIEIKSKLSSWMRRTHGSLWRRGFGRGRRETRAARIEGRPGWAQRQDGGDYVCVVGLMGRRWQVWRWPW